jgi:hypothetical protein
MSIQIPEDVKEEAKNGIKLMKMGFHGGTTTGWNRAKQLSGKTIDPESLSVMRAWFARHGPDAANGGTSYRGYNIWNKTGRPTTVPKDSLRGAVAWLIWGGDPAYRWLKSVKIRNVLKKEFPDKKEASFEDNLL